MRFHIFRPRARAGNGAVQSLAVAPSLGALAAIATLATLDPVPRPLGAQTPAAPKVYTACYVASTGTVYRIKEPGTPSACATTRKVPDVEFSWTDGAGALRVNAAVPAINGLAVIGQLGYGVLVASGPGERLVWHPYKAAFRAGGVIGDHWDDAKIGFYSAAFGWNSTASGHYSLAAGDGTTASGAYSVAMGRRTTASGHLSTALGANASTNDQRGSFVYGDGSSTTAVTATAENQFVVRASGGVRLRTSPDLSTGCDISAGNLTCTGTVVSASDVARKDGFEVVDADSVLGRLAVLPIQRWHYKADPAGVRHVGPTAQDFRAAFGLGANDKTISMVDADGVNMLAIQALERRTRELQAEHAALRREAAALRQEHARMRDELAALVRQRDPSPAGRPWSAEPHSTAVEP